MINHIKNHEMKPFSNKEIDVDTIPMLENISYNSIAPLYLKIMRIWCVIGWSLLILLGIFVPFYFKVPIWINLLIVILFVALFISNFIILSKAFEIKGYALREKDISYRKGLFFRSELTIPYKKVQQVSISQNLFEKYYNLFSLSVCNATGGGVDMNIRGLTRDEVDRLKLFLASHIETSYDK